MMKTSFTKLLTSAIILLFTGTVFTPDITASEPTSNQIVYSDDNGSLSGYVTDPATNPIEGAVIRASCGENYFENVSDSLGYYYIDNIPIVFCLWNVSASKKGYKTIWIETSIGENTTLDFVLTPLGNTLYVGGDGPGNYTRIQDAIDDAGDGDTVFVYGGVYKENIIINKTINLIGEDRDNTIIDCAANNEHIISVFADGVSVNGFTIQNSEINSDYVAAVNIRYAGEAFISDNIIAGCYDGILLESNDNQITKNIIRNNNKDGICFGHYRNNIAINSDKDNSDLYSHNYNVITQNDIIGNSEAGLSLAFTMGNNISENNLIDNGIGIGLRDCNNNIIRYNNFMNNNINAIDLSINPWNANYWDDWIGLKISVLDFLPYYIPGTLFYNFDWHPAKEPYDIPAGGA